MSGVDFSFLAGVILFLFATWMTGRLFRAAKLPGILGELFMGILLGPNVFDLVPFASDGTCPFISFDDTATAVVANASGSQIHREFIVYEHRQAFPEYIVYFKEG